MKIYDKEMYEMEKFVKAYLLAVIIFLLGFIVGGIAGYMSNTEVKQDNEVRIEVKQDEGGNTNEDVL